MTALILKYAVFLLQFVDQHSLQIYPNLLWDYAKKKKKFLQYECFDVILFSFKKYINYTGFSSWVLTVIWIHDKNKMFSIVSFLVSGPKGS